MINFIVTGFILIGIILLIGLIFFLWNWRSHKKIRLRFKVYKELLRMIEAAPKPTVIPKNYIGAMGVEWKLRELGVTSDMNVCFCRLLNDLTQTRLLEGFDKIHIIKQFPELMAYKPGLVDVYGYWFNPFDAKPRIEILKEILKTPLK